MPSPSPSRDRAHEGVPPAAGGPITFLSYFICATKRIGSTLLCEYLRNSRLAGDPQEYFNPYADQFGTTDVDDFLRVLLERKTEHGVFGCKVFWEDVAWLLGELGDLIDPRDASAPEVLNAAFPNLHYIWMRRSDRLRQAISLVRALQTSVWWSTMMPADHHSRPVFNFEAIDLAVRRLTWRDKMWQRFFQHHAIRPFMLEYDEIVEDPAGRTRDVLHFLGIQLPDSFVFPSPQLQKQADDLTEEWVRQYELLRQSQYEGWTPAPAAFGWNPFPRDTGLSQCTSVAETGGGSAREALLLDDQARSRLAGSHLLPS